MDFAKNEPQLRGLDYWSGLQRLQGNQELYLKLLHDFADRYRQIASQVRQSLENRDPSEAQQTVHNVKGLAGNLSATHLYQASQRLDEELKQLDPNWEEIEQCFAEFETAVQQAVKTIDGLDSHKLRASDQAGQSANPPNHLPADFVNRLRASIELGDIMALIEIADSVTDDQDFRDRLKRLVDDLDFQGLSDLADQLQQNLRGQD